MKRLVFILLLSTLGVWAAFFDAFWGLILHTWYTFGSPLELSFGKLSGSRLSFVVGIIVLLTTLQQERRLIISSPISFFALSFLGAAFLSLAMTLTLPFSSIVSTLQVLTTIIIMALVAPVLINSHFKLRIFILTIVLSSGLLAAYYGVFGLLAGSRSISGPGKMGDNNGYAVWIATVLPLITFCIGANRNRLVKLFFISLFCGNLVAIVLTFSRGGMIACALCLILLAFRLGKVFGLVFGLTFILFALSIINSDSSVADPLLSSRSPAIQTAGKTIQLFVERIRTLQKSREDIDSAVSRVHFWKVALYMFRANPVFGVGFGRYSEEYDTYDFLNGAFGQARAVHNTFLAIIAETGLLGSASYALMILACLFAQQRALARVADHPDQRFRREIRGLVASLRIILTVYLLGGSFVMCIFQETFWVFVSLSLAVERIIKSES